MVWWMWAQGVSPFMSFQHSAEEVSERQASPVDLLMAQHGVQACCLWSPTDGFFHFSDNWLRITGFAPEQCFEQGWFRLMSDAARREWESAVHDLSSPDPAERVESSRARLLCCDPDDDHAAPRWLDVLMLPMPIKGRACYSLLVSDVTSQKQLEQAAGVAIRESQLAQHGRSSFLSNMSHELGTPLNAILGFAQMLEQLDQATPEQRRDYLKHIRESGEDLLSKITDLLEVANVDSQTGMLDESVQNLGDLIDATIEMQSHAAYRRDVRVCQPSRPRAAIILRVDRPRMIHALSNLLCDAIRRADRGGIIQFDWRIETNGDLSLSISDDGSGFSHKQLGNIKTALRSKRAYYLTDIDHIGVGMSVAKELVSLHGGELHIEHCQEQGTRQTIRLPAERVVSESARIRVKKRAFA